MVAKKVELVAIVGPTASGKTSLAIALAKAFNGEIIAVDSRTIYKGLDIGTAKPTKEQQSEIKHWGLDVIEPNETYSAAQFKTYANKAIKDIAKRGKLAILVGGTGLYMDGVLYNFSFAEPNHELRKELGLKTVEDLQAMIVEQGIPLPVNSQNKLHLITALERKGKPTEREKLRKGAIIVGLNPDRVNLRKIVKNRVDMMVKQGVQEELTTSAKKYGWSNEAYKSGIYKTLIPVINNGYPINEALKEAVMSDMRLAKRQMTWLKRNPDIEWFEDSRPAKQWLSDRLLG